MEAKLACCLQLQGLTAAGKGALQGRGHVIDAKDSREGQLPVPVVLASVGICAQRITNDTISPLHLGIGILVVALVG